MAPGWIGISTGSAISTPNSGVLFEWDADDNLVPGDPDDFAARFPHVRDVFKYFSTEDAIERIIAEIDLCHVSCDWHNSRILEGGLLQI